MQRHHHAQLASTNDEARRLAQLTPGMPLCVTADQQQSGRGRRGRAWSSPLGGLWMSVAWPMQREPAAYDAAPVVIALAIHQSLEKVLARWATPLRAPWLLEVKWPNDLLLNGKKMAGVLCERELAAQPSTESPPSWGGSLIIGIGVNANFDQSEFPDDVRFPATTISTELGFPVDLAELTEEVIGSVTIHMTELDERGLAAYTLAQLTQHLAFRGQVVDVQVTDATTVTGRLTGIAQDGSLSLVDGETLHFITVGEVARVRPAE